MSPLVVLVGPPGAGKTTVAEQLGQRLAVAVRDTDHDIERGEGMSVQDIFVDHGEAHFRLLEEKAVATALEEHDGVLALGGGAVLSEATRERLASQTVVFLDIGLTAAVARVGMNANRPLLLGNVRSQMKQLLDERRGLYRRIAGFSVATDDLDAAEVTDRVVDFLQAQS